MRAETDIYEGAPCKEGHRLRRKSNGACLVCSQQDAARRINERMTRTLPDSHYREIEELEGIRTMFEVASEFNIDPVRVKAIWNGEDF